MYQIALKMLFGDKAKFLTLVVGLTFSVMLLTQQGSIFCGLMLRTASNIFETGAPIWVVDPKATSFNDVVDMKLSEVLRVRSVQGVKWAVPLALHSAIAQSDEGDTGVAQVIGVDDQTLIGLPKGMTKGRYEDINQPGAVIIAKGRSERYGSPQVGDYFELNDQRVRVVGMLETQKSFSPFPIMYTTLNKVQQFFPEKKRPVSFILVKNEASISPEKLIQKIQTETGLHAYGLWDFVFLTMKFWAANTGIPINLGINVLMVIIIGTVISAQTLYAFMLDNTRQFGTFKAIGIENKTLAGMVLFQSAIVGIIGHGIGSGVISFLGLINPPNSQLAFYTPPQLIGITFVLVCGFCLLAAVLSIIKVLRIDPAIVFRG
ncbi:MAG: FtsX-like permease family protein [Vampirovibrio sp.]|jgi:putative ABC transport system permease protein|nr:FtsX-like permease family protein [Vampirovibrio sp.]